MFDEADPPEPAGLPAGVGVRAELEGLFEQHSTLCGRLIEAVSAARDSESLRVAVHACTRAQAQIAAVTYTATSNFDAERIWEDDDAKNAATWLRTAARLPADEAARQVRHARKLRTLPQTEAALRAGDIGVGHVARIANLDNPRTRMFLRADEKMIVEWAKSMRFDDFGKVVCEWRDHVDPDGGHADRAERRWLSCSETLDGAWKIDGWFDPLGGHTINSELERQERLLFQADWDEARARLGREPAVDELRRSPARRRADALIEMAKRSAIVSEGSEPRVSVMVVAGHDRFADVCETLDGTPITTVELTRALLDGATVQRLVFDEACQPIAASKQRCFTAILRRAIQVRDRECTHPYCDTPGSRCEIDHIIPYSLGGPTSIDNGRLYCAHHNRLRHKHRGPPTPDDDTDHSP